MTDNYYVTDLIAVLKQKGITILNNVFLAEEYIAKCQLMSYSHYPINFTATGTAPLQTQSRSLRNYFKM